MTAPVLEAAISGPTTTSVCTIDFPPHSAGDLLVIIGGPGDSVSVSQTFSVSSTDEGSWAHPLEAECYRTSGLDFPTHEAHMFWARAGADHGSTYQVTVSASSAQGFVGAGFVISGVPQSGDPIDAFSTACGPMSTTTSVDIPGVTTSTAECLVIHFVVAAQLTGGAGVATFASWANGTLSGFAEVVDNGITSGNDKSVGATAGEMASPGATGNATATASIARYMAYGCFAVKPGSIPARWYAGRITI